MLFSNNSFGLGLIVPLLQASHSIHEFWLWQGAANQVMKSAEPGYTISRYIFVIHHKNSIPGSKVALWEVKWAKLAFESMLCEDNSRQ